MKTARIEETVSSVTGERVLGVSCRDGHEMMELTMIVTSPKFDGSIRRLLTSEWERHREEFHGGA